MYHHILIPTDGSPLSTVAVEHGPQRPRLDQRHKESDGRMGCTPNNGAVSLGRGSELHDPRPGSHLWHHRHTSIVRHGHSGQANCTSLTLAEWLCRTVDRIDPPRVLR